MKIRGTYRELSQRVNEINKFTAEYPTIAQFIQGHIKSFTQANGGSIKQMNEEIQKIYAEHVVSEGGRYLTHPTTGEPECKSAEDSKLLTEKYEAVMQIPVIIIV